MRIIYLAAAMFVGVIFLVAGTTKIGTAPILRTNAPGEASCGGCHSGNINTGSGSVNFNLPAKYNPGQTYTLNFEVDDNAFASGRHGFTMTALDGSQTMAGSFMALNAGTSSVQTGTVSGAQRQYMGHKNASASTDDWTFEWTAPASNVGPVTFYTVGVHSNGLNNTSGDYVYQQTFTIAPASPPQADFGASKMALCLGETVTFTDSSQGSINAWSWSFGADASPATSMSANPGPVSYATPGTKTITLIAAGADGVDTVTMVITVEEAPTLMLSPDTVYNCSGTPVVLSVPILSGTFEWSCSLPGSDCQILDPNAFSTSATPNWPSQIDQILYFGQLTSQAGCASNLDSIIVLRNPTPEFQLVAEDSFLCPGEGTSLLLEELGSNEAPGPFEFSWVIGGFGDVDSVFIQPTVSDQWTALVTDANGCVDSFEVTVDVFEPQPISVNELGGSMVGVDEGVSFAWFFINATEDTLVEIVGANMSTLNIDGLDTLPGYQADIVAEIVLENGCTVRSEIFGLAQIISSLEKKWLQAIELYPNPSGDLVRLSVSELEQDFEWEVLDLQGKQVLARQSAYQEAEWTVKDWTPGIYLVQIWIEGNSYFQKLQVQPSK
ncbi:choice-of-anchor V domain-containing protein [Pontibacter sp. G13]|uniref:choice-of-anchor V domain-containing protein n=1 Tax=Pontibacter sp. G13 TaxID=3074898 RepID=UPI00288B45BB|nr:choice-of-anchor V domain-containing protein [Pontibacter sp. G13]WNJ17943.1 choice-of-anchor V domain-containing protein [Pontibacter sp. G13]